MHKRLQSVIGRGPSTGFPIAKAAVDMAVHNYLCARSVGQPLRSYLGASSERATVALSYTLTARDEDAVRREIDKPGVGVFAILILKPQ